MVDIKSMDIKELTDYIVSLGEKKFRAGQIYDWMHKKLVTSFDEMSSLPVSLRERLKKECSFTVLKEVTVRVSKLDETRKYLFLLPDGNIIESVYMK